MIPFPLPFFYQDRLRIDIGSFTNLNDKLLLLKETLDKGNIGVEEKGTIDLTRSDMLIFNNIKGPGISGRIYRDF